MDAFLDFITTERELLLNLISLDSYDLANIKKHVISLKQDKLIVEKRNKKIYDDFVNLTKIAESTYKCAVDGMMMCPEKCNSSIPNASNLHKNECTLFNLPELDKVNNFGKVSDLGTDMFPNEVVVGDDGKDIKTINLPKIYTSIAESKTSTECPGCVYSTLTTNQKTVQPSKRQLDCIDHDDDVCPENELFKKLESNSFIQELVMEEEKLLQHRRENAIQSARTEQAMNDVCIQVLKCAKKDSACCGATSAPATSLSPSPAPVPAPIPAEPPAAVPKQVPAPVLTSNIQYGGKFVSNTDIANMLGLARNDEQLSKIIGFLHKVGVSTEKLLW